VKDKGITQQDLEHWVRYRSYAPFTKFIAIFVTDVVGANTPTLP